jgi:hypothetical protein
MKAEVASKDPAAAHRLARVGTGTDTRADLTHPDNRTPWA